MIRVLAILAAFWASATAMVETKAEAQMTYENDGCRVTWHDTRPYGDGWIYELQCAPKPPSSVGGASGVMPAGPPIVGKASHYGSSYENQWLGCGLYINQAGDNLYHSADPTIIAVAPAQYREWPCGTTLRVTGPAGSIVGIRQDACPGCSGNWIDLSEAAFLRVCGAPYLMGICEVSIEVLR